MNIISIINVFLMSMVFSMSAQAQNIAKNDCHILFEQENAALKAIYESTKGDPNKMEPKKIFPHALKMADVADECGQESNEFYVAEKLVCQMYLSGSGVEQNVQKGISYCESGARHGNVTSLLTLSFGHMTGDYHVPVNFEKALHYMDMWMDAYDGFEELHLFKAAIYRKGGHGIENDDYKAFEEVRALANMESQKSDAARCELSHYYREGIGVPKNEDKANKWLALYKENNPDEECKQLDFEFLKFLNKNQKAP